MTVTTNLYGEKVPRYETKEEESAAIRAFLNKEYDKLTSLEIEFFRSLEEDPDGSKFAADHAGQIAADVDPAYLAGMTFVFGDEILDVPHPITNWYLYQLERTITHNS